MRNGVCTKRMLPMCYHTRSETEDCIYYGAADSYVGLAFTQFEDIMKYIMDNSVVSETDTELGKR